LGDSASVIAEYREAMYATTIELTPAQPDDGRGELELRRNRL
jgi:hypothetical protein